MQLINSNKKALIVFLLILIFFGSFNYFISNLNSEITYFENCNNSFSKELNNDRSNGYKNSIFVKYEQIPIYPEIQNIKCLNKIIGKTIELDNTIINYYVGYSRIVLILQGILFSIFLFLVKKFILNINFFYFLFFTNTFLFFQFFGLPPYILLTQILKLNIILLIIKIFINNLGNILNNEKYFSKIQINNLHEIKFLMINISLFIFFEHLKNFYYENYLISFSSWTINYAGGINRRGLIGEILTYSYIGIDLKLLVALIIALVYAAIFYSVWIIFKNANQNYLSTLIMISPYYFLFVVNDFRGGNFKEILGLLSFVLLVLYNFKKDNKLIILSILLYTVSIFSHTVNLFIFPIIIFYIYKYSIIQNKKIIYTIYTAIVALLVSFVYSPLTANNYFDTKIWCSNLISNFNLKNSCNDLLVGNMLDFKLNASLVQTIEYTFSNLTPFTLLNYLALFLLANSYIFKTKFFVDNKKELILIYLSFTPLFVIALDWGRWLYILFFVYSQFL